MKTHVISTLYAIIAISFTLSLVGSINGSDEKSKEPYKFAFKWGSNGTGDGQFMAPHDIDFDSLGNVYVSDRDLNNIQKFTSDGKYIMQWGKNGSADGEFDVPYSLSIDKSDKVYVVDRQNNRTQKFTSNGTFLMKWDIITSNEKNYTLNHPEDMDINDVTGDIYIADTGNHRIIKVDKNFNFVTSWGSLGKTPGKFSHPHGIGIDSSGNVFVNDLNDARIQKFDKDGKFIKQWGSEGTQNGQFSVPLEHLFVDDLDNVWMVDGVANPRIQKFDNNGEFILSLGTACVIDDETKNDKSKMEEKLPCDGKFHEPEHANIDDLGNLYVVDRGNERIEVFTPSNEPEQ